MPEHEVTASSTPLVTAQDIIALMGAPSPKDKTLVEKAYAFAAEAHKNQKRFSGEPYITHLAEVGKGLAQMGMSATTIAAGLLHDSVEDVNVLPETIEKEFGTEIRFLVEGVTKLGALKYRGSERHVESLRKLLVATSQDVRVLIIKLVDRLHNMQTLQYVPAEKRRRIALETLEIYAPIAHRLGIGVLRQRLDDLAFQYSYPEDFEKTKRVITERQKEITERLEDMIRKLRRKLADAGLTHFESDYRVKGIHSLWLKLQRKESDPGKIFDIAALRVIVDTIPDCYRVLGLVHELWQPLPNKIKDYIAFPKPNGYQSLHTTVFSGDGGIVEIQIRTRAMHAEARYGIASHVSYKGAPAKTEDAGRTSSFDWIMSLIPGLARSKRARAAKKPAATPKYPAEKDVGGRRYGTLGTPEWLAELGEHDENPDFKTSIKTDLFSERVFVFTPNGDVVDLPAHSTPIDFAYAIHSDIGDHIAGVKIRGKMVPLTAELHNGDIVEIETRKNAHPTAKWLSVAKTNLARRHIRMALDQEQKS